MHRILVVEDERRMRELIADYLEEEGFEVVQAGHGEEAIAKLRVHPPGLIILDIMMPGMDGFEVCRRIREESDAVIVMLTAKSEDEDKLYGYELGADDYVTKPFSPKVLTAKVKALLNRWDRRGGEHSQEREWPELAIDENAHEVRLNGRLLPLSPKEYDLLLFFSGKPNMVWTREVLLDQIWGMDYFGDVRTVDTHIKRLRQKLGDKACWIQTVRGNGYKFQYM